jgi:DNA-binding response OmpR family regulator
MIKRILVVEDDIDIVEVLDFLLTDSGYIVEFLFQAEGIWDKIEELKPDLILLDIMLPDGDGRDICKELKQNLCTAKIPVIMVSGHDYIYDTITTVKANDIVTKPFKLSTLLYRIERQLIA